MLNCEVLKRKNTGRKKCSLSLLVLEALYHHSVIGATIASLGLTRMEFTGNAYVGIIDCDVDSFQL